MCYLCLQGASSMPLTVWLHRTLWCRKGLKKYTLHSGAVPVFATKYIRHRTISKYRHLWVGWNVPLILVRNLFNREGGNSFEFFVEQIRFIRSCVGWLESTVYKKRILQFFPSKEIEGPCLTTSMSLKKASVLWFTWDDTCLPIIFVTVFNLWWLARC